jgi:hypothetical protein
MADNVADWDALAADVTANFLATGHWFATGTPLLPEPVDWDALALEVTANFLLTGQWFAGPSTPPATAFAFVNDPSSTLDTRNVSVAVTGNTAVQTGGLAVNLTEQALPDLGLLVPYAWPRLPDAPDGSPVRVPLTWDGARDGWFTPDFDGTGTSLLLTLRIATPGDAPDERLAVGSVADDAALTVGIPLASTALVPFPEETLRPEDELPFVDLGSFAPGEAKPFDLVFTYHWGDGTTDEAFRVNFFAYTVSPVPTPEAAELL